MKSRWLWIATCMLLAIATCLISETSANEPGDQAPYEHKSLTDDANASAQATTDMSYGGVNEGRSVSGGPVSQKDCRPRARCDIYFGQ